MSIKETKNEPGVSVSLRPVPCHKGTAETAVLGAAATPTDRDLDMDVDVELDPAAEKRLRRKIDFVVVPPVALLYLFCYLDRANIGNARIAGLEADLGLHGNDYNAISCVFFASYILFGLPSSVACKWIGPGWYLPAITLCFGVTSLGTAFIHTRGQAYALRFLLGLCEAGVTPGIAYYLSRWYRREELVFRLSLYIVMTPLSGAFGGLLASGILRLSHVGSATSWRMIFVVEGILTITAALVAFVALTDRPESARFWLSPAERRLAVARIEAERAAAHGLCRRPDHDNKNKNKNKNGPQPGAVLDRLDAAKLWRGVSCPITLATSVVFTGNSITVAGLSLFLPTIIRTIFPGEPTTIQQLYTVPPYVLGASLTLGISLWSSRVDRRLVFMLGATVPVAVGYAMFLGSIDARVRYAATFLIAGPAFSLGALSSAHISANVVSDTARSSAMSANVIIASLGGFVSTWSFLSSDSPWYHIGNGINFAAAAAMIIICALMLVWMERDNRRRDVQQDAALAGLEGLDEQQIEDLDWKHPRFRWRP